MSRGAPEVEVALDGLAAGGDAVGRDDQGRVTFVAGGLGTLARRATSAVVPR